MIALRSVTKRYGAVTALDAVTLEIPRSASVALLGHSGSGKTTLLRVIAGLELPDEGEVLFGGQVVSTSSMAVEPVDRGIGVVFQSPALWPHMTVRQNVAFGLHALDRSVASQRLATVLSWTGLDGLGERYPHELSGGQAQRVALARALAPMPRTLLLDEPLAHVDTDARADLLRILREAVGQTSATLLYVTHDRDEAATLCSRYCRMSEGRVASIDELTGAEP